MNVSLKLTHLQRAVHAHVKIEGQTDDDITGKRVEKKYAGRLYTQRGSNEQKGRVL